MNLVKIASIGKRDKLRAFRLLLIDALYAFIVQPHQTLFLLHAALEGGRIEVFADPISCITVMAIDSSRVNLILTQSVLGPYFLVVDSLDVTHPALAGVRNTPLGSSLAL
jgi:hypothetical protein